MSLNRELLDFLGAFGTVSAIGSNVRRNRYYDAIINAQTNPNTPYNPNSPAGGWVTGQAGPPPPGYPMPPAQSSGGPLTRAGRWVGRQFGGGGGGASGPGGGAVPIASGPSTGMPYDPAGYAAQFGGAGLPADDYDEGGEVLPPYEYPGRVDPMTGSPEPPMRDLPPYEIPGQIQARGMPLSAPSPMAPRGAVPVTPGGNRKALTDQTRTEAYDPTLDGPGAVPVTQGATQGAPAPSSAVPMGAPASGMTGAPSDRGLSTNNARSDLENALHGGMTFAQETFHLNDANSPHHGGGKQALFSGMGAASPQVVQAMDQKVNGGMPYDAQLYAIRRLEAIHRYYSMNGDTNAANKAAFELLQYTAGVAAQWGARAVDQFKAGDMPGAIKSVQEGYNHIPDGNTMQVQGNTATIIDKRTGKTVNQFQFTPEQVFNAAMGLDSRSLYWQVLAQRVAGQTKGGSHRTQTQEDLDRARIDLTKARTAKVKAGKAGAAGPSAAFQSLIDKINAEEPGSAEGGGTSRPPKGTPSPSRQGGDVEDDETGEGGETGEEGTASGEMTADLDTQDQGATALAPAAPRLTPEGKRYIGPSQPSPEQIAGGAKPVVPQQSGDISTEKTIGVEIDGKHYVIPTIVDGKSYTPNAAIALFKGGKNPAVGTFDTEQEATAFAEQRSRDLDAAFGGQGALKKGPSAPAQGGVSDGHPGFEPHYEAPDRVPDMPIAHDGTKYVPARGQPEPFAEEAPKPNPYRKYEAEAAKIPGKEGVAMRQLIQRKATAYDKNVKAWEQRRKEHDTSERHRLDTEAKAGEGAVRKSMAGYDQTFKGRQLEDAQKGVEMAWEEADKRAKAGGKFDDPKSEEATKAAATATKTYPSSIFADKQVSQEKLKSIAFSLMTSNPNMTAERAVRLVQQLTMIDAQDATKRTYKPVGRDVTASKNVVVQPAEGGPHKFAPVHIRPEAYDDLKAIVQDRLKNTARRMTAGAAVAGEETGRAAAGGMAGRKFFDRAKDVGSRVYDEVTKKATPMVKEGGRTMVDDLRDAGSAIKGAVQRIPGGTGDRIPRDYPIYGQRAVPIEP